jgi:hypothetical protein
MKPLMKDRLAALPGLAWNWTCCSPKQEPVFRALLDRLRPERILEIGTHQGVSTALLAEYGEVATVDVLPNPARARVWDLLGVAGRITERVCKSQWGRDYEIREAAERADLAFIDGSHLMRDLAYDFELVTGAGCRRVILHDYWQNAEDWPDVKLFVDGIVAAHGRQGMLSLAVEIHKPFVLITVLP